MVRHLGLRDGSFVKVNFAWPQEMDELAENTVLFLERHVNETTRLAAERHRFDRAKWEKIGQFGLLGLTIPEFYGGSGLGVLESARLMEAFGLGCTDTGLAFSAATHLFACATPIVRFGNKQTKNRWLPRLAQGQCIGAHAITEAEAGSDAFALSTRATRVNSHYILDGTKTYVTNAPVADVLIVYAKTQPKDGYLGITAFAVDRQSSGIIVGEPFETMGLHSSPASVVYLNDCRIPATCRLGEEGQGAMVFNVSMEWERACLFALYLGCMDRTLHDCIDYARSRRQFGRRISRNQAVAHRIADMKLRLESARLLVYKACWLLEHGNPAQLETSLAKLAVSEAAVKNSLDAIQIHGGTGYISNVGVERLLRDAIPSTIFSGTSEIQRDIVARQLGL